MKRSFPFLAFVALMSVIGFGAFQCGSPEFTGAKVYMQQGKYDQAIEQLEKEVAKNPNNAEAWRYLGILKSEKSDYAGMNSAFDRAKALTPKYNEEIFKIQFNKWAQHLNAGLGYYQKGSEDSTQYYEKAIAEYNKAIEAKPDTGLTYRYIAIVYTQMKDDDKAFEAYTKAWEMSHDVDAQKQRAIIFYNRGETLKEEFEKVNYNELDLMKKLADVRKNMSREELIRKFGEPDKGNMEKDKKRGSKKEFWKYPQYNLSLTVEGSNVVEFDFSKPYEPKIDSALYRQAQEQFTLAVDALEAAKKLRPTDNSILDLLMRAYVQADKLEQATTTFEVAVENDPGNKLNRFLLGILYRSGGKNNEAIKQFEEAVKLDSTFGDVYYEIGVTYYNWGVDIVRQAEKDESLMPAAKEKFAQARPYIERVAAEFRKDDPQIYETLGRIYAQIGEQEKAIEAFNKADALRNGAPTP